MKVLFPFELKTLKMITTLAFIHYKSNPNTLVSEKTSETITTLVFVHCESNPITLVSENFENDNNIGFRTLQKQLNHIGFQKLRKQSQH